MQENAEQYFLSSKARFQLSEDEEDAAELYFAAYNLANHGHEVDWDSTLKKMETILKANNPELVEGIESRIRDVAEGITQGKVRAQTRDTVPPRLRGEDPPEKGPRFSRRKLQYETDGRFRERGASTPTDMRQRIEGLPPRHINLPSLFSGPAVSWWKDWLKTQLLQEDWHQSAVMEGGGTLRYLPTDPESEYSIEDIVREMMCAIPTNPDDGKSDPASSLKLHHENCDHYNHKEEPVLHRLLRDYYHPTSDNHVGKLDEKLDTHEAKIMEGAELHPDIRDKLSEMSPEEQEHIIGAMQMELGYLSQDMHGLNISQARHRLYERAFEKWDDWYREKFPNSPLLSPNDGDNLILRREMFVQYCALRNDGCYPDYIERVLYDDDGGILGGKAYSYNKLRQSEDYDHNRDESHVLGTLSWLLGLEMLDKDPRRHTIHPWGEVSDDAIEEKIAAVTNFLHSIQEDIYKNSGISLEPEEIHNHGHSLFGVNGTYSNLGFRGFSSGALRSLMKRNFTANINAICNAWVGDNATVYPTVRPDVINDKSDAWRDTFERALKQAHKTKTEEDKIKGKKVRRDIEPHLPGAQPIYDKIRAHYRDDWGEKGDTPNVDINGISDVTSIINDWVAEDILTVGEGAKLLHWVDSEKHGLEAETKLFASERSKNHHNIQHLTHALPLTRERDVDIETPQDTYEGNAYFPTFLHLGRHGQGFHIGEPIHMLGQWLGEAFFMPQSEATKEISDVAPRYVPCPKSAPHDERCVCYGTGMVDNLHPNSAIGQEVHRVEDSNLTVDDIRDNPRFPNLSYYLRGIERDDPNQDVELKDLISRAYRAYMGTISAFPDENVPSVPSSLNEDMHAAWRTLFTPVEYELESIGASPGDATHIDRVGSKEGDGFGWAPITHLVASLIPTRLSHSLARQMLELRHIGWTEQTMNQFLDEGINLPGRSKEAVANMATRNRKIMDMANAFSIGGAIPSSTKGATNLQSVHMRGHLAPMEAFQLAAIHRTGGRDALSLALGNSRTKAASAMIGIRDRVTQRHNERQATDLEHRFRAMLWGEAGTPPLKYSNGTLVVENPSRFYELLDKLSHRRGENLTDIMPDEFLGSHPLSIDGSLAQFWPLIMGKKVDAQGKIDHSQGIRGHWRDTISDSLYYWPVDVDQETGRYTLPLETMGPNQENFVDDERGGIEFTEGRARMMHAPSNQQGAMPAADSLAQLQQRRGGRNVNGGRVVPFDLHSVVLEETWPGAGRTMATVPPEQNAEQFLYSNGIDGISPESIVLVSGVPMMVGPHPSELMAQWAEEVVDRVPQTDGVTSLRGSLLDSAEWEVKDQPDYSGDQVVRGPDERFNSGLTIDALKQIIGDETNLFHATKSLQPLVVSVNAFREAQGNPDYRGLTSKQQIVKYIEDELTVHHGDDEKRRHQVLHNLDIIRSTPTNIINHLDSTQLQKYINYFLNRCDDEMRPSGEEFAEGLMGYIYDSTTDYPRRNVTRSGNPANDYNHPLNLESLANDSVEPWARRVRGFEILNRYILNHPEVREILASMSKNPQDVIEDILEHTEMPGIRDTELKQEFIDNAKTIQRVSHHDYNKEPLDWFPIKDESQERRVKEGSSSHQGWKWTSDCSKCGPAMRAGNLPSSDCQECAGAGNVTREVKGWRDIGERLFIPLKNQAAARRGIYAQESLNARNLFASLLSVPRTALRLRYELGSLFRKGLNGSSIMDIIREDLGSIKDKKGNLSFPELHNSITPENRWDRYSDLSENEQFRLLADFLFCEGRTEPQEDQIRVTRPASSAAPTKKLRLGGTSLTPVDRSGDNTLFGHQNIGSGITFDGVFLPPTFTHLNRRDHFGVPARGLARTGWTPNFDAFWGELGTGLNRSIQILHPDVTNRLAELGFNEEGMKLDQREPNIENVDAIRSTENETFMAGLTTLDALTDTDLIYKGDDDKGEGKPLPLKAMHRIFKLEDLEHLRGFSDDWVVSAWPEGERIIVTKKKERITAYDLRGESVTLPNKVREGLKKASKKNFIIDCLWDGDIVHIVDILKAGDEDLDTSPTKDRNRHLRTNFSATEEVSIPAPINTKRVDSEGLERSVDDLMAEPGVKQVLLRDAQATYMKGENRHPKWVILTPEYQIDVLIVSSRSGSHRLGIGPIVEDDALEIGNRAMKFEGEYYMDVGRLSHDGLKKGMYVTLTISGVTSRNRKSFKVFTLQSPRYLKDSESGATDSIDSLEILSNKKKRNVPHKLRVRKGDIHIEFPIGHVVYETEQFGNAFLIKDSDAPSDYLLKLAESQSEYWEPLAAILLRSEKESEKEAVVPEPPANHDKKPKKVLKPSERLLKDPEVVKSMVMALEAVEDMLKEKITWTGPKALGIDYATPVESPHGPTKVTEPYDLPDHDPAARQSEPKACWCGAEKGGECKQGMGHKMEDCPEAHPPKKKKKSKHLKISQDS